MSKDFILNVQSNNVLRITAFGMEHIDSAPCLIFAHGFKGFKDWGFGPYIGDYFSKKGFFVLTFNFSHNGVGDSLTDFVELDKFAENTFLLEIDDSRENIDVISLEEKKPLRKTKKILRESDELIIIGEMKSILDDDTLVPCDDRISEIILAYHIEKKHQDY